MTEADFIVVAVSQTDKEPMVANEILETISLERIKVREQRHSAHMTREGREGGYCQIGVSV